MRGWWEHRFGKAIMLYAPSGGELDLHLGITGGYFGEKIDHDDLWSSAERTVRPRRGHCTRTRSRGPLAARMLPRRAGQRLGPSSPSRCRPAGVDQRRRLADARSSGPDATAWTWSSLKPSDHVVRAAPRRPATNLAHGPADFVPDRAQRRAFGYMAESAEGWAPEGLSVLAALSFIDQVRFLAGLAAPSRASLRFRQRTWPQHLRSGAAIVRARF